MFKIVAQLERQHRAWSCGMLQVQAPAYSILSPILITLFCMSSILLDLHIGHWPMETVRKRKKGLPPLNKKEKNI